MSVSPIVGSRNLLDPGVLEKIKESASVTPAFVAGRNEEGSYRVAERVRAFASSSYRVVLSPEAMKRGPVYTKPK
ncbi:MAG: hypothetical protein HQL58_04965 [Magnetococcales bacterium]|nr:hypothetical protein [Magnetococcales bacterium]